MYSENNIYFTENLIEKVISLIKVWDPVYVDVDLPAERSRGVQLAF